MFLHKCDRLGASRAWVPRPSPAAARSGIWASPSQRRFCPHPFGHFAPAIWLYAGHALSIAAVGFRLVAITRHLEQGDHVERRQFSSVLLVVPSLLAIALSFAHPRGALWALALNFAAPVIRKWSKPAAAAD